MLLCSQDAAVAGLHRTVPSLTHRSLYLKQESNHWDPEDNKIVQVTRKMADTICHMTQYLKKKGPIPVTPRGECVQTEELLSSLTLILGPVLVQF